MEWADETTERLISLWGQGLSTAEIGRRLGVSKNAVIGRAHRIGLTGRPSPIRRNGEPKVYVRKPHAGANTLPPLGSLAPLPKPQAPAVGLRPQPLPGYTRPTPPAPAAPRAATSVLIEPAPKPYGRVVPCSWPMNNGSPWRFCCQPSERGRPYCPAHTKLAYVRVRDRREDAA